MILSLWHNAQNALHQTSKSLDCEQNARTTKETNISWPNMSGVKHVSIYVACLILKTYVQSKSSVSNSNLCDLEEGKDSALSQPNAHQSPKQTARVRQHIFCTRCDLFFTSLSMSIVTESTVRRQIVRRACIT